jgi:hypothetical protein
MEQNSNQDNPNQGEGRVQPKDQQDPKEGEQQQQTDREQEQQAIVDKHSQLGAQQ